MSRKTFKSTFLSYVVLNAGTATEGNQQSLDYVPGSCFLGIVAQYYDGFKNSYDIFHSGKVRFCDAHIAIGNKRSLKQPALWFYDKTDENKETIYLHHLVTDKFSKEFITANPPIQLKQIRTGYFIGAKYYFPKHNFAIKSAYNFEERRSEEGKLYGYDALCKGSEWIFSVDADDDELLKEVSEKLIGEHNIGRSKTSQYGKVKIEELFNFKESYETCNIGNDLTIYFESCAAFIDEHGNPVYQPTNDSLGLTDGKIDWERSQILTKSFAPWNGQRKTRDADKVCIDKGSVIVVKNGKIDKEKIAKGIGVYRNEGFGRVIINPDFLQGDSKTAKYNNPPKKTDTKKAHKLTAIVSSGEEDELILSWIKIQSEKQNSCLEVLAATNEFMSKNIDKFKHISPSQWGSIRERAQGISDFSKLDLELFRPPKKDKNKNKEQVIDKGGYLRHGKAMDEWRNCYKSLQNKLIEISKNKSEKIARHFLINLCSEMAKKSKSEGHAI